jgi:hypothetical protein
MACDPNDLAKASKCFQCLDAKQLAMVQAYTLAVIAGGSTSPETLLAAAAQFQSLSDKELKMVQAYLLCKISGG